MCWEPEDGKVEIMADFNFCVAPYLGTLERFYENFRIYYHIISFKRFASFFIVYNLQSCVFLE